MRMHSFGVIFPCSAQIFSFFLFADFAASRASKPLNCAFRSPFSSQYILHSVPVSAYRVSLALSLKWSSTSTYTGKASFLYYGA